MESNTVQLEKVKITFTRDNGLLTIAPNGRIESNNATQAEQTIQPELHDINDIILDFSDLDYISSAGLRIILRLKKLYPTVRAINVSSEVYDIFQVTGFAEMMDVQRAFRRLSVEGCEVIGTGANGTVYRYDEETIIKVFRNADALDEIKREQELARTAFVLGVPTAISYDIVKVEGDLYGSVFELLNADTFQHLLVKGEKTVDEIVALNIELLRNVHSRQPKAGALPSRLETAKRRMRHLESVMPADDYAKLTELIDGIPENPHMLHCDFHVKNVMVQNGECLLIDMDSLCVGDPIFEFAGIYLPYVGFSELDPEDPMRFFGIPLETSHELFYGTLRGYFEGTKTSYEDALLRSQIIAYAHLLYYCAIGKHVKPENIERFKAYSLERLHELLPKTDTLSAGVTY